MGNSIYYDVYVLKLENNKYYVGLSKNVNERFNMHCSGLGARWTKKYKPIKIMRVFHTNFISYLYAGPIENEKTIEMMKKYGRENVRGGEYCAVKQDIVDNLLGVSLCKEIDAAFEKNLKKRNHNRKRKIIKSDKEEQRKIRRAQNYKIEKIDNQNKYATEFVKVDEKHMKVRYNKAYFDPNYPHLSQMELKKLSLIIMDDSCAYPEGCKIVLFDMPIKGKNFEIKRIHVRGRNAYIKKKDCPAKIDKFISLFKE